MEILDSTAISWIEYVPDKLLLKIRYTNSNTIYAYYNVPSLVYEQLLCAESKGSFVNRFIKEIYDYSVDKR